MRNWSTNRADARPSSSEANFCAERLVAAGVLGRHAVEVGDGVDDLVGVGEERPGRLGLEVEVEAAQVVAVGLEVVGEEDHRAPGVDEVEHHRGVVGDEHVGDEVEVADVRVVRHVAGEATEHRGVDAVGDAAGARG